VGRPLTLIVGKEMVLSRNVQAIRHSLNSYVPDRMEEYRNRVILLIGDYEEDSRDLFLIPEVRAWFHELFLHVPELFFWMDMDNEMLIFYALMHGTPVQKENGVTIASKGLKSFLVWGYANLNNFCAKHKLDVKPTNGHIRKHLDQQIPKSSTTRPDSLRNIHEPEADQLGDLAYISSELRYKFICGENCDQLSNAIGDFGRSPNNPIPVNGAKGVFKYLNKLRSASGCGFFFHRVCSVKSDVTLELIDMYEIVALDASHWDVLFLDIYHPRRSNAPPDGLTLIPYNRQLGDVMLAYGVDTQLKNFPYDIPDILESKNYIPSFIRRSREFLRASDFLRPSTHLKAMQAVKIKPVNVPFEDMETGAFLWLNPKAIGKWKGF